MRTSFATAVAASGLVLAQTAFGQNADKKLGKVHFATSCKPEAQKLFNRGMLYQHSFWYRASQQEFEDVLKADPECGIAYWGIALSLLWNPHVPTPAKNLTDGAAAIAKAKAVGAKTQRERDYIDALSAMYADLDKVDLALACRTTPRPWNSWRSAIRKTMRRRSTTRSRSTLRRRRPIRLTPTSSRVPPS